MGGGMAYRVTKQVHGQLTWVAVKYYTNKTGVLR